VAKRDVLGQGIGRSVASFGSYSMHVACQNTLARPAITVSYSRQRLEAYHSSSVQRSTLYVRISGNDRRGLVGIGALISAAVHCSYHIVVCLA
jgi:hypothetical protein